MEQKYYISNDGQLINADKIDYYVVIDNQSNIPTSYQVVTNENGENIFIKQEAPEQQQPQPIEPQYLEYVKVELAPEEDHKEETILPDDITPTTTNHEHNNEQEPPLQPPVAQQDAKQYQCYVCKNLFFSIQSVKTHFAKCHPKEPNVIISCECALRNAHLDSART